MTSSIVMVDTEISCSKTRSIVRRCRMCLQGMESTVSLLCLSAASHTGHSLSPPLSLCASASSGTPGSKPSAGNSAPVDTRGENTKHLTKYLGPWMWQEAKDAAPVKHCDTTSHCTFTDYKQMFSEALCTNTSKNILFIIKFYKHEKNNHQTASGHLTNPPLTAG